MQQVVKIRRDLTRCHRGRNDEISGHAPSEADAIDGPLVVLADHLKLKPTIDVELHFCQAQPSSRWNHLSRPSRRLARRLAYRELRNPNVAAVWRSTVRGGPGYLDRGDPADVAAARASLHQPAARTSMRRHQRQSPSPEGRPS